MVLFSSVLASLKNATHVLVVMASVLSSSHAAGVDEIESIQCLDHYMAQKANFGAQRTCLKILEEIT